MMGEVTAAAAVVEMIAALVVKGRNGSSSGREMAAAVAEMAAALVVEGRDEAVAEMVAVTER